MCRVNLPNEWRGRSPPAFLSRISSAASATELLKLVHGEASPLPNGTVNSVYNRPSHRRVVSWFGHHIGN